MSRVFLNDFFCTSGTDPSFSSFESDSDQAEELSSISLASINGGGSGVGVICWLISSNMSSQRVVRLSLARAFTLGLDDRGVLLDTRTVGLVPVHSFLILLLLSFSSSRPESSEVSGGKGMVDGQTGVMLFC